MHLSFHVRGHQRVCIDCLLLLGVQGGIGSAASDMADYVHGEDEDCPIALQHVMFFKRTSLAGSISGQSRFRTAGEKGLTRFDIACQLNSLARYAPENKSLILSAAPAGILDHAVKQAPFVLDARSLGFASVAKCEALDNGRRVVPFVRCERLGGSLWRSS